MKTLPACFLMFCFIAVRAQTTVAAPVEETHETNYLWWLVGVLVVILAGIALYMLIKKDPKKDAN